VAVCALATLNSTVAVAQPPPTEAPPIVAQRPAIAEPSSVYSTSVVERWIEDADFVYSSRLASFNLPDYIDRTAPHLSPYAEHISHWCGYYSISPLVLLSVMEMRSGIVSAASPQVDDPFAGLVSGSTLQEQVLNALAALAHDFYAYRAAIPAPDATAINAGTYALLNLFRGETAPAAFASSAAPIRSALLETLSELFPDARRGGDDIPGIAAVPPVNLLQFPWKNGVSRRFNGVHTATGTGGIMSSIDFYKGGQAWGSDTSTDYVVAAHAGIVTKLSSCGVRVTSSSGWQTSYYHLDGVIVTTGQLVTANETLGVYANNLAQATCTGGNATGPHVHFDLLKDGIYFPLDGVSLNGYLVHPGRFEYDFEPAYMWLEKSGVKYYYTQALVSTASPMPNLTINDVSVTEGNAGTTTATFTLTMASPAIGETTVTYTTEDITALSGTYVATSSINIPSQGTATPYPSTITVPAGVGTLTKVTVTLDGFGHTYGSDVDILLVGPTGKYSVLMSRKGSGTDVSNLTITFDDAAIAELTTSTLSSGTYRVQSQHQAVFPSPAPTVPQGANNNLVTFAGTNPSGTWRLYVIDQFHGESGTIARGWRLTLTLSPPTDYAYASGTLTFPNGASTLQLPVTIHGDTTVEAAETFRVALSNASNAIITDGIGVGTIQNDDHTSFTDATLTAGTSTIKLIHVAELRTAIDAARAAKGLAAFAWTDPVLTAGVTTIRAAHVTELRSALAQVYAAAGVTAPSYTDASLLGVPFKAVHITELRSALLAVE
jgi:LasA protease